MNFPLDDDVFIQASQLFTDAIQVETLIVDLALDLENGVEAEKGTPKKCEKTFIDLKSKSAYMIRASIMVATQFQSITDDYRGMIKKRKTKKGFKDF